MRREASDESVGKKSEYPQSLLFGRTPKAFFKYSEKVLIDEALGLQDRTGACHRDEGLFAPLVLLVVEKGTIAQKA